MSLKVWFPFNNTKENKGASEVTLSPSYNPYSWGAGTGKTSKECAVFNGNTANTLRTTTKELNYTDNFSWCMWIKPNFNSSVSNAQFAFVVGRADGGGWGYGVRVENNVCTIKFGSKSYSITTNPNTAWYHIAFTKKGNTIITYRNGAVAGTYTFDGVLPTYSDSIGLAIGSFGYNYGTAAAPAASYIYPCYSSINDFRIYDHCLSKKEVREISRALVCHIPLNNISGLTSGSNLYSWDTGMSAGLKVNAGDGSFVKESVSESTAENGKCLKIRCTKATTANDARGCYFNTGVQIVTGKTYTYSFWVNFNTTKSTNIVLGFERFGTVSINYKTGWTKYTRTAVATNNGLGVFIFYIWCKANNQIWNVGDYVLIRDLKIEEGGVATDWCPNSSDSEFKTYGYNNVITDCSGFGNNASIVDTNNLLSNTATYQNYTLHTSAADGAYITTMYKNGVDTNFYYTVSCKCNGTLASSHSSPADPSKKLFTLWVYNDSTAYSNTSIQHYTNPMCFTSTSSSYRYINGYHTWTFKPTAANVCLRLNNYSDGTTFVDTVWSDFKLETGPGFTYKSPNVINDSKVYDACTDLNSNTKFLQGNGNNLAHIFNTSSFSISYWVCPNTGVDWQTPFCCGSAASQNKFLLCQLKLSDDPKKVATAFYGNDLALTYSFTPGNWYHIVHVVDAAAKTRTIYCNGVSIGSGTYTTGPSIDTANATFGIGRDHIRQYYVSDHKESDLKIYATALSADDVKAMYESAGSVDKQGSIHAHEFSESTDVTNVKVKKNKTVSTKGIIEGGSYLDDDATIYYYKSNFSDCTSKLGPDHVSSYTPSTSENSCLNIGCYKYTPGHTMRFECDIEFSGFSSVGSTFKINFQGANIKADGTKEWKSNMFNYITEWNSNYNRPSTAYYLTDIAKAGGKYHVSIALNETGHIASDFGIRSDNSNGTGKVTVSNIRFYDNKYYKANKTRFFKTAELVTAQINEI